MVFSGGSVAGSVKARLRRSTLLDDADYKSLLDQPTVSDIALQLSQNAYGSVMKGFTLEGMRRTELEFLLDAAILAEGVAFRHYLGPAGRKLLDLWLENFDIELFKNRFRVKFGTQQWENRDMEKMIEIASGFNLTLVDQERLFGASTLKDLLASVKNEALKKSLSEVVPQGWNPMAAPPSELQKTTFSLGMILDRYYFNNLYVAISLLGGNEGRMMRMLFGSRLDLMNLYWIYRGKRFFAMSPEEALTLITKVRYLLDFKDLSKLAFADLGAWGEILKHTPYAPVFDVDEKDPSVREVEIERNVYKILWNIVNRVFRSGTLGFHNVAAYLMLKELEVRDLIAIIEAVRYSFDQGKVELILIRPFRLDDSKRSNAKSGD